MTCRNRKRPAGQGSWQTRSSCPTTSMSWMPRNRSPVRKRAMTFLLDTHVLLRAAGFPDRLPTDVLESLEDPDTELVYSAASLWEVATKSGLGRADFRVDPRLLRRGLLENGYQELPVTGAHAAVMDLLPEIHRDPFDRILVAQAQVEGVTLLTMDEVVGRYPGPIRVI